MNNHHNSADNVVGGLRKNFKLVGLSHVHEWYAWAIVGIVLGMALMMVYVSNRSLQAVRSSADGEGIRTDVPYTPPVGSAEKPKPSSWPAGHGWPVSSTYGTDPKDHSEDKSHSWPADHGKQASETWVGPLDPSDPDSPPKHDAEKSSGGWPKNHTYTVSKGWPATHTKESSLNWPGNHSYADSKATWPNGHTDLISSTWPHDHSKTRSARWPALHSGGISDTWNKNPVTGAIQAHNASTSVGWKADHKLETTLKEEGPQAPSDEPPSGPETPGKEEPELQFRLHQGESSIK